MADAPVFSGNPDYGIPDFNYHDYICAHDHEGYELVDKGKDSLTLETTYATGAVTIWDEEIVEFSIANKATGENVYYLHFPLNDRDRAVSLFDEFVAALIDQQNHRTVNVLLSCTSGWTTTLFANKLNRAAKTLSLDYSFEAVPVGDLYEQGMAHDVVLLAPQVNYLYEQARNALPEKPVIQIPTNLFATEDAGACIQLVRDALERQDTLKKEEERERPCSCKPIPLRILCILMRQTAIRVELAWQLTDGEEVVRKGTVTKKNGTLKLYHYDGKRSRDRSVITPADFADLIGSVLCTEPEDAKLDAIAVAMIGSVCKGVVGLPNSEFDGLNLEDYIGSRFHIPTVVSNNVNAAALGWYEQQDTYQTIVFHSQSRGIVVGGQGLIIDGHLHEGRKSDAGEIQRFLAELPSPDAQLWHYEHRVWDPTRIVQMLAQVFAVDIGTIAPEVICVRSRLTPDMDQIKQELLKYVPEEAIPDLIYVPNFSPYVYAGLIAMAQDHLGKEGA